MPLGLHRKSKYRSSYYFVLLVCFVEFVDSFFVSESTFHESHETHEVTRNVFAMLIRRTLFV